MRGKISLTSNPLLPHFLNANGEAKPLTYVEPALFRQYEAGRMQTGYAGVYTIEDGKALCYPSITGSLTRIASSEEGSEPFPRTFTAAEGSIGGSAQTVPPARNIERSR